MGMGSQRCVGSRCYFNRRPGYDTCAGHEEDVSGLVDIEALVVYVGRIGSEAWVQECGALIVPQVESDDVEGLGRSAQTLKRRPRRIRRLAREQS